MIAYRNEVIKEHLDEDISKNPEAFNRKVLIVESKFQNIKKLIKLEKEMSFLDVGSGAGLVVICAAEKGLNSYGIEILPKAVEIAKKNAKLKGVQCNFSIGINESLPYENNSFDIVYSNSVLEHVGDWEQSVKELVRVLKNKGVLYLATTNKQHPFTQEIKYFPLFPYYPQAIQQKIIKWAVKRKPGWVGHMPQGFKIVFHSYSKIKKLLKELNCEVCDAIDLYKKESLTGFKRALRPFWKFNRNKMFRWVLLFYTPSIEFYAIKKG